jgi:hypothetical protein
MLQVIECVEAINNGDESGTRIKLQGISPAGQINHRPDTWKKFRPALTPARTNLD